VGSNLTAQDVLVEAAVRGADAAGSDQERADLLKIMPAFKDSLLGEVRDGDFPGLLAAVYVVRAGKKLGAGLVLALQGRAVICWMKGFLKRPTAEVVPLASISSVELGRRRVPGNAKPVPAIFVEAVESWELICSPDVPAEAPLYGLLVGLLDGSVNPEQWPVGAPETEAR
jgi:hypothetical protein